MAPLPDNSTSRIFVDYSDQYHNHTWEVRYSAINSSSGSAMLYLHAVLQALVPGLYTLTILGARDQHANSLITSPLTWPHNATYGAGVNPAIRAPLQTMFLGRTPLGRRWRFSVFGMIAGPIANFRISSALNADVAAAYAAIVTAHAASNFTGIDGGIPALYDYVSQNYNNRYEVAAHQS